MADLAAHDTADAPVPMPPSNPALPAEAPPPAPPSAAALLADAIAKMNHPSNLDLQSKMHVMQNAINVMAQQLGPLLPTE